MKQKKQKAQISFFENVYEISRGVQTYQDGKTC
jgi:hypothetical protein